MMVGALLGALAMPACGAPEPGDEVEGAAEELSSSSYTYHCRAQHQANGPELFTIHLSRTHAKVTALDPSLVGADATYAYQAHYHPRTSSHKNQAKYLWRNQTGHDVVLLVDEAMRTGGAVLHDGGHGGYAVFEGPIFPRALEALFCER
jgi:hypothetical protein